MLRQLRLAVFASFVSGAVFADTVTLGPVKDNTL